ncbi:hypothetical protein IEQ34_016410 [Dendrobium chrysotoxum]|uniref:Uncharacterized protein n=1 Tax=Dendrobium chrysotoxum TaxID=161865 RepID=A0AAV7GDE0_DENCH|nr:hypothetical protein IEQ34_016410 [Dendrobium chrysotoxum]
MFLCFDCLILSRKMRYVINSQLKRILQMNCHESYKKRSRYPEYNIITSIQATVTDNGGMIDESFLLGKESHFYIIFKIGLKFPPTPSPQTRFFMFFFPKNKKKLCYLFYL